MFWFMGVGMVAVALLAMLLPLRTARSVGIVSWPVLSSLVVLPSVTLGLYLYLGAPAILSTPPLLQARANHDVDAMLTALQAKLSADPQDVESWYILGRSQVALQHYAQAETALETAIKLAPNQARLLSQYAEILALRSPTHLQGRPTALIERALELDERDEKALELAGLGAYERQDWAQAAHYWRRLLKLLPLQSDFYQDIEKAVQDAQDKAVLASGRGDKAKLIDARDAPKSLNPH